MPNPMTPESAARLAQAERRVAELEAILRAWEAGSPRPFLDDLRDREEKYRRIVNAFDGLIYISSKDRRLTFVNQALIRRTGYDPTGEICHTVLHGLDQPCPWCEAERVLGGETARRELRSPRDDRWFYVVSSPVLQEGTPVAVQAVMQDITERKRMEDALRESEERYRIVADNTFDWEFWFSPGIRSLYQSPSCQRISGYQAEEFEADPELFLRIILPEDRPVYACHRQAVMQGPEPGNIAFRIRTRDGRIRWLEHVCQPVFGAGGEYLGVRGSNRDITNEVRTKMELERAKEAAESASRAKSAFLANMSHEIRTPMNAILGLTRLALKRESRGTQREFLEGVLDAGSSLMTVIDDILDFSKIEAGRMELECEPFRLRDLLDKIMKTYGGLGKRKHVSLRLSVHPGVPEVLVGDQGRLRQVLVNLVGNAVKFTQNGEVSLAVEPDPEGPDGEEPAAGRIRLRFRVSDTGVGIPPERLELIFDSFTQGDSSTTRRFGGTGLGLAISKRLTAMMNGRIWAESTLGEGSIFFFTAAFETPDDQPPGAAAAPDALEAPGGERSGLNILLAEDDRLNRLLVETFLIEAGHRVASAGTGREVLKILEADPFDLVLMDISMPDMDGLEATRAIRDSTSGAFDPDIPILAMTAHALKGDRERFLAAGMDGYIPKPVDLEELRRNIGRFEAVSAPGEAADRSGQARAVLNEAWITEQFAGTPGFFGRLAGVFLGEVPRRLTLIDQAARQGDMDLLGRAAQDLKDAADVLGAGLAGDATERVVAACRDRNLALARGLLPGLADVCRRTVEALRARIA